MKMWYSIKINQQNLHTWGYFFAVLKPYKGEWYLRLRIFLFSFSARWKIKEKKQK